MTAKPPSTPPTAAVTEKERTEGLRAAIAREVRLQHLRAGGAELEYPVVDLQVRELRAGILDGRFQVTAWVLAKEPPVPTEEVA